MEVYIAHLVQTKVPDDFIAPFEVEVINFIYIIDALVNIYEVFNFELVLIQFNSPLEIFFNYASDSFFQ